MKIVIPSWRSAEVYYLVSLTVFLALRTFLSIYISSINGRIVKAIIKTDRMMFLQRILNLALCAVPASFINSYLDYLNKRLAISVKKNLTIYFHNKYLKDMTYYQVIFSNKSASWYTEIKFSRSPISMEESQIPTKD